MEPSPPPLPHGRRYYPCLPQQPPPPQHPPQEQQLQLQQLQLQLQLQPQQYRPTGYDVLSHQHELNLNISDPRFGPLYDSDHMLPPAPPPVTVGHQPFYATTATGSPAAAAPAAPPTSSALRTTTTTTSSSDGRGDSMLQPRPDDCSSCYNDDCTDKCDDDDCRGVDVAVAVDACSDCPGGLPFSSLAHCSLGSCEIIACPVSPCTPVPCAQAASAAACTQATSVACQTVVCEDEVCPVEASACAVECVDEIFCHDSSCQETCHTVSYSGPASSATTTSGCPRPSAAFPPPPPAAYDRTHNCVSYHVNNANSSRWQRAEPSTNHYSSISPNSLSLDPTHFNAFVDSAPQQQQQQQQYGLYGSASGEPFGSTASDDMAAMSHPLSTKRRKTSDTTSTSAFDRGYSTTPSSSAAAATPTPAHSHYGDIACQWDDDCDETFFDSLELEDHIQQAHIGSQTRCRWDSCGQESADPNSLFDHFKYSHAAQGTLHTCLWDGCDAALGSDEELQAHLDSVHIPSAARQCKWGTCEAVEPSGVDLEKHVRSRHLAVHAQKALDDAAAAALSVSSSAPSPSAGAPAQADVKRCEWQDDGGQGRGGVRVCGVVFPTATDLQQHAKDVHINALRKRTGYHCHWAGCGRRDKPFSQKGKVERHLQTHTGCKTEPLPRPSCP